MSTSGSSSSVQLDFSDDEAFGEVEVKNADESSSSKENDPDSEEKEVENAEKVTNEFDVDFDEPDVHEEAQEEGENPSDEDLKTSESSSGSANSAEELEEIRVEEEEEGESSPDGELIDDAELGIDPLEEGLDSDEEDEMRVLFKNEAEKLELLKGLFDSKFSKKVKINRKGEFYFEHHQRLLCFLSLLCSCVCYCTIVPMCVCIFILMLIPIITLRFDQFWDYWCIYLLFFTPLPCCCVCLIVCCGIWRWRWVKTTFSDHNQTVYVKHGTIFPFISYTKSIKYGNIHEIVCRHGWRTPWDQWYGRFRVAARKSNGRMTAISAPIVKKKTADEIAETVNECLLNAVQV